MKYNFTNSKLDVVQIWIAPKIPVNCSTLKAIGIYFVILLFVSIISNLTLIAILWRLKNDLKKSFNRNIFKFALAVLSLFGALIELPLTAASAFKCK